MRIFEIPITPLREEDRIKAWEHLFRAAVGHILAKSEAGVKTAVITRVRVRIVEIEVSKETVKCDSLGSVFELLKETLNPPVNEYEATKYSTRCYGDRESKWTIFWPHCISKQRDQGTPLERHA